MRVDGAVVAGVLAAPDLVQKLLAAEDLIGMRGEKIQKLNLPRREVRGLSLKRNLIILKIDFKIREYN